MLRTSTRIGIGLRRHRRRRHRCRVGCHEPVAVAAEGTGGAVEGEPCDGGVEARVVAGGAGEEAAGAAVQARREGTRREGRGAAQRPVAVLFHIAARNGGGRGEWGVVE